MKRLILLALFCISYCTATTCRGLLLGGGGDRGGMSRILLTNIVAWEAGVLRALLDRDYPVNYDVVVGISGGAINAAVFASHDIGEEAEVSADMTSMWMSIKHSDMFEKWSSIIMPDLRTVPALFDSKPQHDYLRKIFDADVLAASNRRSYVAVTGLDSYEVTLVPNNDPTFLDAVVASSAFPLVYPPVKLNDTWYIDGAVSYIHTFINNLVFFHRTGPCHRRSLQASIHQ